jgi:hypothetical protein
MSCGASPERVSTKGASGMVARTNAAYSPVVALLWSDFLGVNGR